VVKAGRRLIVTLDELEHLFDLSNPEALERWDQIVRATGMYTVALFAQSNSEAGDVLRLAGTGTLVAVGEEHYILTAHHVWDRVLRGANNVGISLREGDDHRYFMSIKTIVPFSLSKPNEWNEWGPDVVFLRIPPAHVGDIKAFRVFYRLPEPENPTVLVDAIETRLLMGTPHDLGTFTQTHASVQILGLTVGQPTCHERGGLDYVDVEARPAAQFRVTSFGGFSGGGLWVVDIFANPKTGKIDSVAKLEGMAFWEFNVANGQGTIRCHGRNSIEAAMAVITPYNAASSADESQ
jgi:hypothetical protein